MFSEQLAEIVARTIRAGSAYVVVTADMHGIDPAAEAALTDVPPLEGVVDFSSGRCRLVSADTAMIMDAGMIYQPWVDGQWIRDDLRPGEWPSWHPCWSLEAIEQAATNVRQDHDGRGRYFEIELDRDLLHNFTYAGLARDWDPRARVRADGAGRAIRIDIVLRSSDSAGQHGMRMSFALSDFGTPVVFDLPPPDRIIGQAEAARFVAAADRSQRRK